jgi:hypothetical protein
MSIEPPEAAPATVTSNIIPENRQYELGKLAGWREGYAAAERDLAERGRLRPESVDAMVIDRLTELLGQLRGQAAA